MKKLEEQFWVTNISNRNVSLSDLGLTIPAFRTINLLDNKHYSFNKEILIASANTGSLYKKRNKIVQRKVPPTQHINKPILLEINSNAVVPTRRRSVVKVEEIHYEELDIHDETFAATAADLTDQYRNIK